MTKCPTSGKSKSGSIGGLKEIAVEAKPAEPTEDAAARPAEEATETGRREKSAGKKATRRAESRRTGRRRNRGAPAAARTAAPAKPAKSPVPFPAAGIAIPENVKLLVTQFDTDRDGKISRSEYDKMPDVWKKQIRSIGGLKEIAVEAKSAEPTEDAATPPAEEATKPVVAKNRPAKKPPAEPKADEPADDETASPPAAPQTAAPAKSATKEDRPFPAGGVVIPDDVKLLVSKFDTNHDGRLSADEFSKMPDVWKVQCGAP